MIDNKLIKKLQSEINFTDDQIISEIDFTESEIKEIELQKLNAIKIQLVNKYLNGDQSSLNLENNSSGSNPNQTQTENENESESESESKTESKSESGSENESESETDKESKNKSQQIQMPKNDLTDDQYENELRKISKQMLKNAYNILEDERIESNTGKNQRGSFVRFNQKNKDCGIINFNHVDDIADPNSALLAVRQFKNDLVKQTKYSKCERYIIESRLKDNQSGLILIVDYWNEQLKPYLKDLKKNLVIKKNLKNKTDMKIIIEKFKTTIKNENWDLFDELDKQYCNDVIETISSITEKQIHLQTKHLNADESGSAYVYYQKRSKTFEIVIPENDKMINYKTELEHEYSHVLHKTSFKYFFELMDQLVDKFIIELKQSGDLKN